MRGARRESTALFEKADYPFIQIDARKVRGSESLASILPGIHASSVIAFRPSASAGPRAGGFPSGGGTAAATFGSCRSACCG